MEQPLDNFVGRELIVWFQPCLPAGLHIIKCVTFHILFKMNDGLLRQIAVEWIDDAIIVAANRQAVPGKEVVVVEQLSDVLNLGPQE